MPGKKDDPPPPPPPKERITGKCAVCKIIYDSKRDKIFRKGKMNKTNWVGCDKAGCGYWGHASCVELDVAGKDSEKIPFYCFKHEK